MKTNRGRICELAIVTAVFSLLLPVSLPGSVAAQGDWFIEHNEEYVIKGDHCHIIATDGVNHVEGSFEWGSSGLTFKYTYDDQVAWYDAPADYQSGHYNFDFNTNWQHYYGDEFIIWPNGEWSYRYYCILP